MKKTLSAILFGFVFMSGMFFHATSAVAAEPQLLSTHGDWAVYTFTESGNKVCYMASQPKKAEGNYTRRGDIFAFVTHRPGENSTNVFSYITGYTYKQGAPVRLQIGSNRFELFSQKDMAWARNGETDQKISDAVRRGSTMVVTGTSSRGIDTKDTFSLRGSSAAHDAMSRACGV